MNQPDKDVLQGNQWTAEEEVMREKQRRRASMLPHVVTITASLCVSPAVARETQEEIVAEAVVLVEEIYKALGL